MFLLVHAIKAYGRVGVYIHMLSNSTVDGREWVPVFALSWGNCTRYTVRRKLSGRKSVA